MPSHDTFERVFSKLEPRTLQVAVDGKSNEITAIPPLLDLVDIHGGLVSIDAMGCQKELAKKIIAGGGEYVLALTRVVPGLFYFEVY